MQCLIQCNLKEILYSMKMDLKSILIFVTFHITAIKSDILIV